MIAETATLSVPTNGRGTYEITGRVAECVARSGLRAGLATVFIRHTSASLIVYENADRSARVDLEAFFARLVPERADYFTHTLEGDDDMPSHLRMVLTRTSECIPVADARLALGAWQGVFVYEHRTRSHRREVVVSLLGE